MLAAPASNEATHLGLEKADRRSQFSLVVCEAAIRGQTVSSLQELPTHTGLSEVGLLPNLGEAMCKRTSGSFAALVGEKELAHLCLHKLPHMLLAEVRAWELLYHFLQAASRRDVLTSDPMKHKD
jgi:hypothetical protein